MEHPVLAKQTPKVQSGGDTGAVRMMKSHMCAQSCNEKYCLDRQGRNRLAYFPM